MPDTPASSATSLTLTVDGASITDTLELNGDHDWFRVTLVAGQTYVFRTGNLAGGNDTSLDTTLTLRDANGVQLRFNDDFANPPGQFSKITFTAAASGTYYLDVGGYDEAETGAYRVWAVTAAAPSLPVFTNDQIAYQLTNTYWGGASHRWNVTAGGSITVDLNGLGAASQTLARAALASWSDAIGISFPELAPGAQAQITFTGHESGAFSDTDFSGGFILSSIINVAASWVSNYGTETNSYSMQTFVHEIGHALGLGHGGNYNGGASYPGNASYANDAWVTTVMSYFDPKYDNAYFSDQGFTFQYTIAPMAADVIAVRTLYGTAGTTRTGNTTYGYNTTSGRAAFDAAINGGAAVTVVDDGGIDTLDYSGSSASQQITLIAEAFSNVQGQTGNLVIARGTVIENAIGGPGADTLTGNAAGNALSGNGGNDTLYGNSGDDTLDGGPGVNWLDGGEGNDRLAVGAGGDGSSVVGGLGADTLVVTATFSLAGATVSGIEAIELAGAANLTLTGVQFAEGLAFNTQLSGNGTITVLMAPTILLIGSAFGVAGGAAIALVANGTGGDDYVKAIGYASGTLLGGAGQDFLRGGQLADLIDGGGDRDKITGFGGADTLTGGAGIDQFRYLLVADSTVGDGADHITDFVAGADLLDFRNFDSDPAVSGNPAVVWSFIGGSAFNATGAAEIRSTVSGAHLLVEVDVNGDGAADMNIWLDNAASQPLTGADFLL